jgi:hypothetical protein
LAYSTLWGLKLDAGGNFASAKQYTANAGASYFIGKTSLSLTFLRTETPLPSSFSALSLSLSRSL